MFEVRKDSSRGLIERMHSKMKKIVAIMIAGVLVFILASCKVTCRVCDKPVFKQGYCYDHYVNASLGILGPF